MSVPVSALAVIAAPGTARARVHDDFLYTWAQVWQAAVRMVRVDLQFPLTDRDEEIGYVMFEYVDGRRSYPGSVELIRTSASDGTERVRVAVQVPSMPSWTERMLLDRLARKLRDDFGDPPRIARPVRTERDRAAGTEPPAESPDQSQRNEAQPSANPRRDGV